MLHVPCLRWASRLPPPLSVSQAHMGRCVCCDCSIGGAGLREGEGEEEGGRGRGLFISVFFFFYGNCASWAHWGEGKAGRERQRDRDDGERGNAVSNMSGGRERGGKRGKGGRDGQTHGQIEPERVSVCRPSPKQWTCCGRCRQRIVTATGARGVRTLSENGKKKRERRREGGRRKEER